MSPRGVAGPRAATGSGRRVVAVVVEAGTKRTFATAADWPGWSRSARTEAGAVEALLAYAGRYAAAVAAAGLEGSVTTEPELHVVERHEGSSGTDFGVPHVPGERDRRPVTSAEAERLSAIVRAAWAYLDGVAARAPRELRKGPRGGGRDTGAIVAHVEEADRAYAREIGLRIGPLADRASVEAMREAMLDVLRAPSDGSPLAGRRWPTRYAANRIAWHALDHAWEIEDRSG